MNQGVEATATATVAKLICVQISRKEKTKMCLPKPSAKHMSAKGYRKIFPSHFIVTAITCVYTHTDIPSTCHLINEA